MKTDLVENSDRTEEEKESMLPNKNEHNYVRNDMQRGQDDDEGESDDDDSLTGSSSDESSVEEDDDEDSNKQSRHSEDDIRAASYYRAQVILSRIDSYQRGAQNGDDPSSPKKGAIDSHDEDQLAEETLRMMKEAMANSSIVIGEGSQLEDRDNYNSYNNSNVAGSSSREQIRRPPNLATSCVNAFLKCLSDPIETTVTTVGHLALLNGYDTLSEARTPARADENQFLNTRPRNGQFYTYDV